LICSLAPASLGRLATLALLWLRWHPTALSRVVGTALARRLVKPPKPARDAGVIR
jgi:hypothetical protein